MYRTSREIQSLGPKRLPEVLKMSQNFSLSGSPGLIPAQIVIQVFSRFNGEDVFLNERPVYTNKSTENLKFPMI